MKINQLLLIIGMFLISYGYSLQMKPLCRDTNNVRIIPMDNFNELINN